MALVVQVVPRKEPLVAGLGFGGETYLVRRGMQLPTLELGVPFALTRRLVGTSFLALGLFLIGYVTYHRFFWEKVFVGQVQRPARVLAESGSVLATTVSQLHFGDLLAGSRLNWVSDPGLSVEGQALDGLNLLASNDSATEFFISVPSLNLTNLRVQVDVNGVDRTQYLPVLKNSLAHMQGSVLPGSGRGGNTFIFGHSMLPLLARNTYESAFTYLPKVTVGDVIRVKIEDRQLQYQVIETKIVDPSDVSILAQPPGEQWITLMTCIPPGFGQKRLLVKAQMVSAL